MSQVDSSWCWLHMGGHDGATHTHEQNSLSVAHWIRSNSLGEQASFQQPCPLNSLAFREEDPNSPVRASCFGSGSRGNNKYIVKILGSLYLMFLATTDPLGFSSLFYCDRWFAWRRNCFELMEHSHSTFRKHPHCTIYPGWCDSWQVQ